MKKYYIREFAIIDKDIISRFEKYHWDQEPQKLYELYLNLIEEEYLETIEAMEKRSIVDYLDWMADMYRVSIWAIHYAKKAWRPDDVILALRKNIDFIVRTLPIDILVACLHEVCMSNYSKSTEKREDGKIIKWENYRAPNIKNLVEKFYRITL